MPTQKNKTFATFLAAMLGVIGAHRFYLQGFRDIAGWVHALAVPLALMAALLWPAQPAFFLALPVIISALFAAIEALVIGLTPDEKWDTNHNPGTGRPSKSGWPLATMLVLTFGVGAMGLIAVIARSFDLLFTGGAYG
ncbi:NINE protein [Noviherbaspirillum agri]